MKSSFSLFAFCAIALLCAAATTYAIPTPNHIMLKDGHRLTFDGTECRKAIQSITLHHMMKHVDPENLPNIPQSPHYDATKPLYSITDQFDGMIKWLNMTDLVVPDDGFLVDSCVVHNDAHGIRFEAKNVRIKASASFEYQVDEKLSIINNDKGKVELTARGDVDALVFAHPSQEDHSDSSESGEEHVNTAVVDHYDAHVFTFINDMKVTFSESPYAEFYNQLAAEHVEELKWLVSLATNEWTGDVLDDYLNPPEGDEEDLQNEKVDNPHHDTPAAVDNSRFIDLGMILNTARPTLVESPEEIKRAHAQPTRS